MYRGDYRTIGIYMFGTLMSSDKSRNWVKQKKKKKEKGVYLTP